MMYVGCKKDFGDLNVSPNATITPPSSALLTNVESQLGTVPQNTELGNFVQYYSELQYPGNSLYATTSLSWDGFYAGPLKDLQKIIDLCKNNPGTAILLSGSIANQIQIARILKVYYFSILTDRYGDIPYTGALSGSGIVSYEKQQNIYNDLFKELRESISSFESGGTAIVGDIIYNGDTNKWKKLANSLRMILAMRLSKVDPSKGKSEFIAALNDPAGYIKDNSDNFTIVYNTSFVNSYSTLTAASYFSVTKTIADTLNKYSDPRRSSYGSPAGSNSAPFQGVPYGLNRGNVLDYINGHPDYYLAFSSAYKLQTSPVVIIPAAYINLLRAEAAADPNYLTGEDTLALFKKGIQDSWSQWGVSGDVNTYIANIGFSKVTRKEIGVQVWLSLFGTTQNAWNEWRRTGFPKLTPSPDAVNQSKQIPRRYAYPLTEANLNDAAYKAAISAFPYGGGDVHDTKIWWDK